VLGELLRTLKAEIIYLSIFSFLLLTIAPQDLATFSTFLEEKISEKIVFLNEKSFD
jgi:hypothetical protein